MSRYENPYRMEAAVVDALLAHLNRLINASNGATRCDPGDMRVPLLTVPHLSTLINVSFWTSFKKKRGARSTLLCSMSHPMTPIGPFF